MTTNTFERGKLETTFTDNGCGTAFMGAAFVDGLVSKDDKYSIHTIHKDDDEPTVLYFISGGKVVRLKGEAANKVVNRSRTFNLKTHRSVCRKYLYGIPEWASKLYERLVNTA